MVGRWMAKHHHVPDFILCSSALRTRQTCTWVCSELGDKAPTPMLSEALYDATATQVLSEINQLPDTITTLLVISHMPAVQDLALVNVFERDQPWAEARRPLSEKRVEGRLHDLSVRLGDKDYLEGEFTAGDAAVHRARSRGMDAGHACGRPNGLAPPLICAQSNRPQL